MLIQLIVTSAATSAWGPGSAQQIALAKPPQFHIKNRVSLIGFVGNDAQLKTTKNGTPVAIFSVATKASWKNSKGGYDSRTEWHRCTAWGKLAEFAGTLEKGAHVQIEGELRYREYKKDPEPNSTAAPIKRRLAEIRANRIMKLDRAAKQEEPAPEGDAAELPVEEPVA